MSKKGVSADEKKSRMLQLFYETGECFQLKVHQIMIIFYKLYFIINF